MSTWVGIAPLIGAGSLDGFAIGALASGACFMAITAPRRARKRQAAAAAASGALMAGAPAWLCEHVMAAEAFTADDERLVSADAPDVLDLGLMPPSNPQAHPTGGRHRLGDPAPASASPDRDPAEAAASFPDGSLPAWTSQLEPLPDIPLHGGAPRGAHRDGELPDDVAFADATSGNSKRSDGRRLPRHAAPAVSLGSRMGNLMTGLSAARALIGNAHG